MDTIDIKCGLTNARRINKRAQEECNTWARNENEEKAEERKEEHENTRSKPCTHRDEGVEKERKMAQQTSFGCFGSQLLLPLATVTTAPSAVCAHIAPPFAIHKIRASCINLCTGVDIPCICRVRRGAHLCVCDGLKRKPVREQEARAEQNRVSERSELLCWCFGFSAQQPIIKQHGYRSMSPFLTVCCVLLLDYMLNATEIP